MGVFAVVGLGLTGDDSDRSHCSGDPRRGGEHRRGSLRGGGLSGSAASSRTPSFAGSTPTALPPA